MDRSQLQFESRLRHIARRNSRMSRGVVYRVGSDGLIMRSPRGLVHTPSFPLKGLLLVLAAGLLLKAGLYQQLGPATYQDRLDALNQGNWAEQAGAWVMQPEPASLWAAAQLDNLLR
jgi:hypothetical protein